MPWQEVCAMSLRKEFVMLALQPGANRRALCQRYGISAPTGYKWLQRYLSEGDEGLVERSRRPHHSPHRTDNALEQAALALHRAYGWGGRKLRRRLRDLGYLDVPSASTLTAVLHRHGLIAPEQSLKHKPWQRFEHPTPNALWQMDFKGHFPTATGRCHALTVLDDHSRFNLTLRACADEQTATVQRALRDTFRHYGLPEQLLLDNGAPWGSDATHRLTPLTVWLTRLGVDVIHSRPYHPQTLGKDERFHRTLNDELIKRHRFTGLAHCQRHFDHYRDVYNLERPHESLHMDVPGQHYQPSPRAFPETLPDIDYPANDIVRKVQIRGELHFRGRLFRVPKALHGQPVALRPGQHANRFDVYFCHLRVADLDLDHPRG